MAASSVKSSFLMHVDQTAIFALSPERLKMPPSDLVQMFIPSFAGPKVYLSETARKLSNIVGVSIHPCLTLPCILKESDVEPLCTMVPFLPSLNNLITLSREVGIQFLSGFERGHLYSLRQSLHELYRNKVGRLPLFLALFLQLPEGECHLNTQPLGTEPMLLVWIHSFGENLKSFRQCE